MRELQFDRFSPVFSSLPGHSRPSLSGARSNGLCTVVALLAVCPVSALSSPSRLSPAVPVPVILIVHSLFIAHLYFQIQHVHSGSEHSKYATKNHENPEKHEEKWRGFEMPKAQGGDELFRENDVNVLRRGCRAAQRRGALSSAQKL